MVLIGLTGSIAMGKTTTAAMIAELGIPVYDADAAVHRLYETGGAAIEPIRRLNPSAIVDGEIDRARLKEWIEDKPDRLTDIEQIVHPLVALKRQSFLEDAEESGAWAVLLDIPLLFETGGEDQMDAVIVVTADEAVQRERVLDRPGMTPEQFELILARQMPDKEKRARADYLVDTGKGMKTARDQVHDIISDLKAKYDHKELK